MIVTAFQKETEARLLAAGTYEPFRTNEKIRSDWQTRERICRFYGHNKAAKDLYCSSAANVAVSTAPCKPACARC